MQYFKYTIGNIYSVISAKNQKTATIEVVKTYLDYMPYATGSYIPEVHTTKITKKEYDKHKQADFDEEYEDEDFDEI